MRTSLNNIKETEDFLSGALQAEETLLFKVRLLLDPALRVNVSIQQKAYSLIRLYGRKKLKAEIESVHENIFNDPTHAKYRREIDQLFNKP
jgi:hypothetical protein